MRNFTNFDFLMLSCRPVNTSVVNPHSILVAAVVGSHHETPPHRMNSLNYTITCTILSPPIHPTFAATKQQQQIPRLAKTLLSSGTRRTIGIAALVIKYGGNGNGYGLVQKQLQSCRKSSLQRYNKCSRRSNSTKRQ